MLLILAVALAVTPVDRPADAKKGAAVAQVLGGKGDVQFTDSAGKTFSAAAGVMLLEADTVKVPVGGFAMLELVGNGYVVRIDEDIELAVKDIALLKAPKARAKASAQLDALLTADEKVVFKERDRLIGWYVSPAAAVVPSTQMETDKGRGGKGDGDMAKMVKTASAPESSDLERPPARRDAKANEAREVRVPSDSPAPRPPAPPPPPPLKSDESKSMEKVQPAVDVATDAALAQCLSAELKRLGLARRAGTALGLRYRRSGAAVTLWLEGAIPAPACAKDWFRKHADALPERASVKVTLQ